MVYKFPPVVGLHPALQLLVLGVVMTALFAPLFLKTLVPLIRRQKK
ncbi:MAG: hypothetical protein R3E56_13925 [Burkholderiaceae bacterium]